MLQTMRPYISIKRLYESQAKRSFPLWVASDFATSGVIPTFNTVSIMPGIENFAPERTDTNNGFSGSPNFFPSSFSRFPSALCISASSESGIVPFFKNWRQAFVVIVNPGGTGKPIRVISDKFAPLPPSRSDMVRSPNVKGYTSNSFAI